MAATLAQIKENQKRLQGGFTSFINMNNPIDVAGELLNIFLLKPAQYQEACNNEAYRTDVAKGRFIWQIVCGQMTDENLVRVKGIFRNTTNSELALLIDGGGGSDLVEINGLFENKALKDLHPDGEYIEKVHGLASRLFGILSKKLPSLVNRFVIAGSIGKHTAIKGKPDLDLVIFVNKGEPPAFNGVMGTFKEILEASEEFSIGLKIEENKCYNQCLQFKVEGIDVDLLLARSFSNNILNQREATRKAIKRSPDLIQAARLYSTGVAESVKIFLHNQTELIHGFIRLTKYWAQPSVIKFPGKSYLIELISIYSAKQIRSSDKFYYDAFKQFLQNMSEFMTLQIIFTKYYVEDDVPENIRRKPPYVMDPINRYNNLCSRPLEKFSGEIQMLITRAKDSLEALDKVNESNIEEFFNYSC